MTRAEFSQRINFMIDELYEADEYFRGYIHLYNQQVSNVERLNEAPGFFQLVLKAFLEMSALNLARLYDTDKETISLNRLPLWIEQNKELRVLLENEPDSLQRINNYLSANNKLQTSLKKLRDQFLAHADKKQLHRNIWNEAGITIGEYQMLIDTAHNILGLCKNLVDEPIPILGMGIESDVDRIIQLLSK